MLLTAGPLAALLPPGVAWPGIGMAWPGLASIVALTTWVVVVRGGAGGCTLPCRCNCHRDNPQTLRQHGATIAGANVAH